MRTPNQGVERMGASRSGQPQLGHHWRLAPTAHTRRSRHPTTARRGRSALGRNDLGDQWVARGDRGLGGVAARPIHDLLHGDQEPALHGFRPVFEASER